MAGEEQIYYLIGVSMFLGIMIATPIVIVATNIYIRAWIMNRMNWRGWPWSPKKSGHWGIGRVHTANGNIREYAFDEAEELVMLGERMYWPKKVGNVERKWNVGLYEFFEGEAGGAQFEASRLIFQDKEGKQGETVKLSLATSTDKPISSSSVAASYETAKAREKARLINKNSNMLRNLALIGLVVGALTLLLAYLAMTGAGEAKAVCQAAINMVLQKGG